MAYVLPERQTLITRVGTIFVGIRVEDVIHVIVFKEVFPVYGSPTYVIGITMHENRIYPMFNINRRLGIPSRMPLEKKLVLLMRHPKGNFSFPVDNVERCIMEDFKDIPIDVCDVSLKPLIESCPYIPEYKLSEWHSKGWIKGSGVSHGLGFLFLDFAKMFFTPQ